MYGRTTILDDVFLLPAFTLPWRPLSSIWLCFPQGIHLTAYSPLSSIGPTKDSGGGVAAEDPVVQEIADKLGKTPSQVGPRSTITTPPFPLPQTPYPLPYPGFACADLAC